MICSGVYPFLGIRPPLSTYPVCEFISGLVFGGQVRCGIFRLITHSNPQVEDINDLADIGLAYNCASVQRRSGIWPRAECS